jgi:guanine deaminase
MKMMSTNEFTALEQQHMDSVVQLSLTHVKNGGLPFAAIVVDGEGRVIGQGVNLVNEHCDPTAHAEIEAIRAACNMLETPNLSGKTLYASGEPCALCYIAAQWAGISQIYFASDRHEVAIEGFDYRWSYDFFKTGRPNFPMKRKKIAVSGSNVPFNHGTKQKFG